MLILIIIVGIFLIVFNVRAILKEKRSFSGVLNVAESNTEDIDVKIGELRREFAESLLEIQKEIEQIKYLNEEKQNNLKTETVINAQELENAVDNLNVEENRIYSSENIDMVNKSPNNNSFKVQEIERLLSENKTIDEIAQTLGIGKGELLLIKELYLK